MNNFDFSSLVYSATKKNPSNTINFFVDFAEIPHTELGVDLQVTVNTCHWNKAVNLVRVDLVRILRCCGKLCFLKIFLCRVDVGQEDHLGWEVLLVLLRTKWNKSIPTFVGSFCIFVDECPLQCP